MISRCILNTSSKPRAVKSRVMRSEQEDADHWGIVLRAKAFVLARPMILPSTARMQPFSCGVLKHTQ